MRKLVKIKEADKDNFFGAINPDLGTTVTTNSDEGLIWIVEDNYEDNLFTIRLSSNPMLALTAAPENSLTFQEIDKTCDNQKWKLEKKELNVKSGIISDSLFKNIQFEEENEIMIENTATSKFFKRQETSTIVNTDSNIGSKWTKNDQDSEGDLEGYFTLTCPENDALALGANSEGTLIMESASNTDNQKWKLKTSDILQSKQNDYQSYEDIKVRKLIRIKDTTKGMNNFFGADSITKGTYISANFEEGLIWMGKSKFQYKISPIDGFHLRFS